MSGNTASCVQTIHLLDPQVEDVFFPTDTVGSCPGNGVAPGITGLPYVVVHNRVVASQNAFGSRLGIGISLGDLCVVEAGLYVTAGLLVDYNGAGYKAHMLSGRNGLTFRRNSLTGRVEAFDRPNAVTLNEVLHKN
jgi:hypothetical protein